MALISTLHLLHLVNLTCLVCFSAADVPSSRAIEREDWM